MKGNHKVTGEPMNHEGGAHPPHPPTKRLEVKSPYPLKLEPIVTKPVCIRGRSMVEVIGTVGVGCL